MRLLDQLGAAPLDGVQMMAQQTLIGGYYGLLGTGGPDDRSQPRGWEARAVPRPNFYATMLHRRLCGPAALTAVATPASAAGRAGVYRKREREFREDAIPGWEASRGDCFERLQSAEGCQRFCAGIPLCAAVSWRRDDLKCYILYNDGDGPPSCDAMDDGCPLVQNIPPDMCFSRNRGQLPVGGDGELDDWDGPDCCFVPSAAHPAAHTIAAGDDHTCAIRIVDGTARCWGSNAHGQGAPPDAGRGIDDTGSII
eukprot:gene25248-59069_t